jgi:hypothetical protein
LFPCVSETFAGRFEERQVRGHKFREEQGQGSNAEVYTGSFSIEVIVVSAPDILDALHFSD